MLMVGMLHPFFLICWCLLAAFGRLFEALEHSGTPPCGTILGQGSMFDDFGGSMHRKTRHLWVSFSNFLAPVV